jgi:uroporphyrinogen decarboxylase
MTGRERLLCALQRKIPDRIPTLEWVLDAEVAYKMAGTRDQIDFARAMGIDGVSVSLNYRNVPVDEKHAVDEWGVTRVSYGEYPTPVKSPIKTMDDFKGMSIPDPDDPYRFGSIKDALKRCAEDDIAVVGRVKDIFSQPRDLMGFEDFLMTFYLDPELIDELMRMCVEHSTKIAKNLRALGVEIVVIGDDIANSQGLLLSPAMFREMVLPHFSKLVHNLKKEGLYVIKHSDGDLSGVLDDLIDTGIDCLDPIDPLGRMDMEDITARYGARIARKGNVDCVKTLTEKSLPDVRKETAACILEGSAHPGHIISSSNSIHRGIAPDNYRAFLGAIREFGAYPLDTQKLVEISEGKSL